MRFRPRGRLFEEWQLALAVQSTGLRQSWQVKQLHASCEGGLLWPSAKPVSISLVDQAVGPQMVR